MASTALPQTGAIGRFREPEERPAPGMHQFVRPACAIAAAWVIGGFWLALVVIGGLCAIACARSRLRVPKGFDLWLGFLLVAVLSITQTTSTDRVAAAGYRLVLYLGATAVFVYGYQRPNARSWSDRVSIWAGSTFFLVTAGGLAGLGLPGWQRPTLLGSLVQSDAVPAFVRALTTMRLSTIQAIIGRPLVRPIAPFAYTNQWAMAWALLALFAMFHWRRAESRSHRLAWFGGGAAGLYPFLSSGSRAAWVALLAGLGYQAMYEYRGKRAFRHPKKVVVAVVLVLGLVGVAFVVAGDVIVYRLTQGHSDENRSLRVGEALQLVKQAPVLGHGAPVENVDDPGAPAAGTHGQMWLVLVSNGAVGAALFTAWWLRTWRRVGRWKTPEGTLVRSLLLSCLVAAPFYELLLGPIFLVMAAASPAFERDRLQQAAHGRAGVT